MASQPLAPPRSSSISQQPPAPPRSSSLSQQPPAPLRSSSISQQPPATPQRSQAVAAITPSRPRDAPYQPVTPPGPQAPRIELGTPLMSLPSRLSAKKTPSQPSAAPATSPSPPIAAVPSILRRRDQIRGRVASVAAATTELFRRGQQSGDSPPTAQARKAQIDIQRRHRVERHAGGEASLTPTLAELRARPSSNFSISSQDVSSSPLLPPRGARSRGRPSNVAPAIASRALTAPYPPFEPGLTSLNDIAVTPEDAKLITQFHTELMADKMELCGRCQQRWFNMELQKDANGVDVCQACRRRDMPSKRNQPGLPPLPYFYSAANKLDFGEVPPQLAQLGELTPVAEMLIARVHVHVQVLTVRGAQYKYRGHVVHFLRDVGKVYSQLPCLVRDLEIVILRPSNTADHQHLQRQFRRQFVVRRKVVTAWLIFLRQHHPGYRDVEVDQAALEALPEYGDLMDQLPIHEVDEAPVDPNDH